MGKRTITGTEKLPSISAYKRKVQSHGGKLPLVPSLYDKNVMVRPKVLAAQKSNLEKYKS